MKLRSSINHLINTLIFKRNNVDYCDFKSNGIIYILNKGKIKIGSRFIFNSGKNYSPIGGDTILRLVASESGMISIGNNVKISNSTLCSFRSIIIEDNVFIGGGCKLWDSDYHSLNAIIRNDKDNRIMSRKIKIKKNAFIGASSIILKGVTVGENSIVGAGSVVRKNISDNEIWAGNPAQIIGTIK